MTFIVFVVLLRNRFNMNIIRLKRKTVSIFTMQLCKKLWEGGLLIVTVVTKSRTLLQWAMRSHMWINLDSSSNHDKVSTSIMVVTL